QAVGLDMQIRKLRWLRAPGRNLVQGSLSDLPFADACFDCVISSEVIEHIPRDSVDLSDMVRVLAPGGTLILGTPDYSRWRWRARICAWPAPDLGRVQPRGAYSPAVARRRSSASMNASMSPSRTASTLPVSTPVR